MEYQKTSPAPVLAVLARCCTYVSGSVVAVLLLFTLIDESILLYVKLADRNLLWYDPLTQRPFLRPLTQVYHPERLSPRLTRLLPPCSSRWRRYVGIFSALFAMSRSLVPGMEDYPCDHEQTMHKVAAHTHYFPPHWKAKCHTYEVRQDFLQVRSSHQARVSSPLCLWW